MTKYIVLCLIFSIGIVASYGQSLNYLPSKVDDHQIIEYTQFTLSYNEEHEQADWVAYKLTRDEVNMKQDRCNCFKTDRSIRTKSAAKSDYGSTGFDLGHLSPAADNNLNEQANEESFLMSNISPQIPGFNRGIWKKLEQWVRDQAEQYEEIYVVTGPAFQNNLGALGKNKVTIPGYYYKVLLRPEGDKMISIGFLMPQLGATGNIQNYMVTVNTIETITKLDFFPELDDRVENTIESQYSPKKWGF